MNSSGVASEASAARAADVRVSQYDWSRLSEEMSGNGCAVVEKLLLPKECRQIAAMYPEEEHFRSHVHMARHGFGKGEYRYFKYPLPELLGGLRTALYPHLANVANEWNRRLGIEQRYPSRHAQFLKTCRDHGQKRPTPLLLQYIAGDFNCLHQDLYGDLAFPLQLTILLSEPGRDFTGGEFVLTEQRPRMQSRVEVVSLRQGDAVIFAVHNRPVQGTKATIASIYGTGSAVSGPACVIPSASFFTTRSEKANAHVTRLITPRCQRERSFITPISSASLSSITKTSSAIGTPLRWRSLRRWARCSPGK